ncbi:lanthionine synthetase LanC family protein, partial [uncultured Phocaeicola sp.]
MNNIFYKHIESLLDRNDLEINLFSGKTGLLLLYSTYKYKNESLIQNTLDEITQKIFTIKEFNFHTGISGIGYGLHLLKRNRKISHELQTIFQYIDD